MKKILNLLKENSEYEYKVFSSKLIPNIDGKLILGVRIPNIRNIAKLLRFNEKDEFLNELPHKYLEENILHSILINEIKDYDRCIYELERFLPFVDNWSVCDTLRCSVLCNDMERFFTYLLSCLNSEYAYKIRFVFVMMLNYFVNDEYISKCNEIAINYESDDYYINMAIAWYFSYALVYEYDKTVYIFEKKLLSKFVHNKSISKACDSYRMSNKLKEYLKSLRIK